MNNNPIIFLDVDGVLNCSSTKERHNGFIGIDRSKVQIFKRIMEATDARFVVSSTWRKNTHDLNHLLDELGDLAVTPRYAGCTPIHESKLESGIYIASTRGSEIVAWLKSNPHLMPSSIVILDDVDNMGPVMRPHLIQTDFDIGLTDEIADRVIARLSGEPEPLDGKLVDDLQ